MLSELKQFCNTLSPTLRALEEGTPWVNKAELYIQLMKEAIRKNMQVDNSSLALWDYCIKRCT